MEILIYCICAGMALVSVALVAYQLGGLKGAREEHERQERISKTVRNHVKQRVVEVLDEYC